VNLRRQTRPPASCGHGTLQGLPQGRPLGRDATTRRATTACSHCHKHETMTLAAADIAAYCKQTRTPYKAPIAGRLFNQ